MGKETAFLYKWNPYGNNKKGDIQVDYNASMNRLSMLNGNDWVSITPTALDIINVIAGSKSIFENVKI